MKTTMRKHVTAKIGVLRKHTMSVARWVVKAWECQFDCLCGKGLCPRDFASLKGDSTGLERGPERSGKGVAHSGAQERGDKSAPGEGTLLFREGKRGLMGE